MSTPSSSIKLHESWKTVLLDEFSKPYFLALKQFLLTERQQHTVYPPGKLIFNAFDSTPFEEVKVVILGQDPYHGVGQAHGLSFSVPQGITIPPSLRNIYKELHTDVGITIPQHGNLSAWANQGVLLLNSLLTVRAHSAGSHKGKGWEKFTDAAIRALNYYREGIVFILWGKYAQDKGNIIDRNKHHVLQSPHPSPFSADRGFFGSRPFSKANELLNAQGDTEIEWQV